MCQPIQYMGPTYIGMREGIILIGERTHLVLHVIYRDHIFCRSASLYRPIGPAAYKGI